MGLLGNSILSTIISLVLIYALLGILTSLLLEMWNFFLKERSNLLKNSIEQLISDANNRQLGKEFYNYITIRNLRKQNNRLPAYISSETFADTLIDIIAARGSEESFSAEKFTDKSIPSVQRIMARFQHGIHALNDGELKELLQAFYDKSDENYDQLKKKLERWFNDYMERVSGWYKNKQRYKLLAIGAIVTLLLNVDSLHLVKMISLDKDLQSRLVLQAEKFADNKENLHLESGKDREIRENLIADIQKAIQKHPSDSTGKYLNRTIQYLRMGDSIVQGRKLIAKEKDSLYRQKVQEIDNYLLFLSQLNIPIGWNFREAPLSWREPESTVRVFSDSLNRKIEPGMTHYLNQRNIFSGWSFFRYVIGLLISAVSLSFGAPFWFDMLVKLVNIRRTGKIPEITTK